jgi:hypothetical protein
VPPLALAGGLLAAKKRPPARLALAPVVLVAAGLAWLLPALAAGDDAYRQRLLGQISERVSGEERGHVRPVWYYAVGILGQALPWTLHLFAGFALLPRARRVAEADRFGLGTALAGSLGTLAILTVVATKREMYMIPPFAFAALAGAYAVHRGLFPRLEAVGRALAFGVLAALALACAVGPFVVPRFLEAGVRDVLGPVGVDLLLPTLAAAVVFGAGAFLLWRLRRAEPAPALRAAAVALVGGSVLVAFAWFPRLDPVLSWDRAARAVLADAPPDVRVVDWGIGQPGVLLWSFDPVRRIEKLGALDDLARALDAGGPRTLVVAEEKAWNAARASRPALDGARVLWRGRVSHRRVVVLDNT